MSDHDLEKAYTLHLSPFFRHYTKGSGSRSPNHCPAGTPVITTNFGSTAEIGSHGGTLLINPRDNQALTNAIRTLLTEPATLNQLRTEITTRPTRNWQNYADELWTVLVEPELATLKGADNVDPINRSTPAPHPRPPQHPHHQPQHPAHHRRPRHPDRQPRPRHQKRHPTTLAHQLITTLTPTTSTSTSTSTSTMLSTLIEVLTPLDNARAWLLLAAVNGRLPDSASVKATARIAELDGTAAAVAKTVTRWIRADGQDALPVRILTGRRLVDVDHTSRTDFATGIQRVTREVTRRWVDAHHPTLIGWRDDLSGMRELTPEEAHRACWGGAPVTIPQDDPTIIPWQCAYILPELAAEVTRSAHLQTMAQYSGTSLNVIGYDLVPITTAETTDLGMSPGFARNLAAGRYARVVPRSLSAQQENIWGGDQCCRALVCPAHE